MLAGNLVSSAIYLVDNLALDVDGILALLRSMELVDATLELIAFRLELSCALWRNYDLAAGYSLLILPQALEQNFVL